MILGWGVFDEKGQGWMEMLEGMINEMKCKKYNA